LSGCGAAAQAATGCISLGAAANYNEYATGAAGVSAESVAGSVAYGGASTISSSLFASASAPVSAITLVIGSSSSLTTSNLAHGSGEYVIKEKDGRRNRYRVQDHLPWREAPGNRTIGDVLSTLG
jgi:hypothetical protein